MRLAPGCQGCVLNAAPIPTVGQWGGGYVEMGPGLISNTRAAPDGREWFDFQSGWSHQVCDTHCQPQAHGQPQALRVQCPHTLEMHMTLQTVTPCCTENTADLPRPPAAAWLSWLCPSGAILPSAGASCLHDMCAAWWCLCLLLLLLLLSHPRSPLILPLSITLPCCWTPSPTPEIRALQHLLPLLGTRAGNPCCWSRWPRSHCQHSAVGWLPDTLEGEVTELGKGKGLLGTQNLQLFPPEFHILLPDGVC